MMTIKFLNCWVLKQIKVKNELYIAGEIQHSLEVVILKSFFTPILQSHDGRPLVIGVPFVLSHQSDGNELKI